VTTLPMTAARMAAWLTDGPDPGWQARNGFSVAPLAPAPVTE